MAPGLVIGGPEVSVLLSPSAFQQSHSQKAASLVPPGPSEPPSTSVGATEASPPPCSKTQLQETLIHLIKVQKGHQIPKHSAGGIHLGERFTGPKLKIPV